MTFQKIYLSFSVLIAALFGALSIPQMFPEVLSLDVFWRILLSLAPTILFGILFLLIYTYSLWIKAIKQFSDKLAYIMFLLLFHPFARIFYLITILISIVIVSKFNYLVIALSSIASIIIITSFKQFPLQDYKKNNKKELVFEDDFDNNKGWILNYWGTTNPSKTNRIENSMIIFEANEDELLHPKKEFGAYIDLKNGIHEGSIYEITCKVKSELGTTMKFQLWLHDNVIGNNSSMRTVKYPNALEIPDSNFKEIKLRFVATVTNGIRIHLHNKGGRGKILVDKVTVSRI